MAVRQGREPWEGRARVRLGGPGARQGRVPVPHSTAPFSLGGHPRGVAGMGPGLTRLVVGGAGVGVALAGGLGVPVGRVGVACVRRVGLAVPDWFWCRGVGGRRPYECPGGAVVRM